MATERVTERSDGVSAERVVERQDTGGTTVVERRGSGAGLIAALALVLLVAVVAWFLLNANRQNAVETEAVSDAASSVANSAENAAEAVGDAVTPRQ